MIKQAQEYFKARGMEKFTCCICGCEFYDYAGYNPEPVMNLENEDGTENVCCHDCNERFVVPARMKE